MKRQDLQNRGGSRLNLATWLSREIQSRDNRMASCPVLSLVLQLAWLFTFWHAWHVCCVWRLAAASHPRGQATSLCFLAHSWANFTLSHSLPLQQTHLNTGLLNAEIQANLARNKANKMVDYIQPYTQHFWSLIWPSQIPFFFFFGRRPSQILKHLDYRVSCCRFYS